MSDNPRELIDAARPVIDDIKSKLPPAVFLVCRRAVEYNDEYYYTPEGEPYDVVKVCSSLAVAESLAATETLHVNAYDISEDVNTDENEDWTMNPDGSATWKLGFVLTMEVE